MIEALIVVFPFSLPKVKQNYSFLAVVTCAIGDVWLG